jgi:hypothetical protein
LAILARQIFGGDVHHGGWHVPLLKIQGKLFAAWANQSR